MKRVLTTYTFTAATKTLDMSATSGFDIKRLVGVVNITRRVIIYAVGITGKGYASLSGGNILTLDYDTTAQADADKLMVIYDDLDASAAAPLRVDPTGTTTQPVSDAGGSLTVDGTVAATQSGTWTVQQGNTANTTAWKVDGSAANQPIVPVNVTPTVTSVTSNNADMVASMSVVNYRSGSLQLSGFGSATVQAQASNDGGATWVALRTINMATGAPATMNAAGIYIFTLPAVSLLRVRTTAYSSGTIAGALVLSSAPIELAAPPLVGTTGGSIAVGHTSATSVNADADGTNSSISDGAGNVLRNISRQFVSNGSTWDRVRNVNAVSILASSARTTTQTGSDQTNYNFRGLILYVNVTSAGTGSITPSVDIKDSVSAAYKTIWTAAAAITTTGLFTYVIGPDAAAAAGYTEAVLRYIGRTFRVNVTANNANSVTYSVSMDLLPF
jgi:hypothetical protein